MYHLLLTMTWPSLLKVGGAADSFIDVVSCKAILLFKKQMRAPSRHIFAQDILTLLIIVCLSD